jgi:hypothetical protein
LSNTSGDTTIGTLAVPAGSYQVTLTADMFNSTANDYGSCHLTSPTSGLIGEYAYFNTTTAAKNAEIGTQGLLSTSGGTITLSCSDYNSITSGYLYSADIDAVQVGAVNGFTTNAATHGTSGVPGKQPGA